MKLSVRAGLAGVAAAAVALGAAEVVAVATGPLSAPLLAVGGVVVDTVPGPVKNAAVAVFGVHDKTALITGTALLLAAYAYGVGVLALRSWRWALAGIALFGAIGVAAAVTRHDAGPGAALPALIGAAVAALVLRLLLAQAVEPGSATAGVAGAVSADGPGGHGPGDEDVTDEPQPWAGRRRFLRGLGIAAALAAVTGVAGRLLTGRRAVTAARNAVVLPTPVSPARPVPAAAQVRGVTPYVSTNEDFYRIDTALYPPQVDPAAWQLRVHGMVRNPITLTWADLLRRPMIERYVTLACVSNEVGGDLIGNARWLGTPVKALLDEADPLPGADQVVQRSVDGWTCGSPTAVLRDGRDALLAIGMNGRPLPVEHGFPVRLVVPGLYGYVSACKWVVELELTRFADFDAYWVPRGWAQQAPIKTQSRIDTPRDGAKRPAGPLVVAGVAWAQHRGIAKVEVQLDGGAWQVATLADTVSADTWRQWFLPWTVTPGRHTLRVRATDTTGGTQPSTPAPPEPDGATGWHSVTFTVE
ncbi:DMSO/TMAO reductase YedYZ molybdopterin-dependent catalytic subunit [Krasilnikovia cinnamomea]|uniref:DMSO/TMAO reductase YedYZ molybdopterin-dependent catalytic subunit n=1 Tax=Krasilnikovia cinnamomea TaxID=349313 RepID=A0A4Q7ZM22_9ACTN|nr:molybdopterin-dependent oxidoreductase [Krasilnikovia cinnamomea]RZU52022.1 DMSO/TMAO reductase YedYZ molybdopterin-dependent catalytic subunit [Krasilnikovia cinnamomea]